MRGVNRDSAPSGDYGPAQARHGDIAIAYALANHCTAYVLPHEPPAGPAIIPGSYADVLGHAAVHERVESGESADLWLQHQPSAELEVFEDSGNLPHHEQADAFCRKLESYLSALAA